MILIRLILFDLDGTLIEFTLDYKAQRDAVRSLAASLGVNLKAGTIHDMLSEFRGADPNDYQPFKSRVFEALKKYELSAPTANMSRSTAVLLRRLKAKYLIGVVTNNCREMLDRFLSGSPVSFDVSVSREDAGELKPAPDTLLLAMRRANCTVEQTIMVGDSIIDIRAANAAGIRSIAYLGGFGSKSIALGGPDYMIGELSRLPSVLKMVDNDAARAKFL